MTLHEAKNEIAKKYGYPRFEFIDFYEVDETYKTQHPPFAEERLQDEAAELYVSSLRSELANYKAKSEGLEIQAKALQDSVITHQEIVYRLKVELAEKEKAYNDLGVKFDKEMERLHDRDHHNRMLIEAADKVIEAINEYNFEWKVRHFIQDKKELIEAYNQLKNTKL